jgi:hypothetical protein
MQIDSTTGGIDSSDFFSFSPSCISFSPVDIPLDIDALCVYWPKVDVIERRPDENICLPRSDSNRAIPNKCNDEWDRHL